MITIVGGGIAGLTLNSILEDADISSVIIEKLPSDVKKAPFVPAIVNEYGIMEVTNFFDVYPEYMPLESVVLMNNEGRELLELEVPFVALNYYETIYKIALDRSPDAIVWESEINKLDIKNNRIARVSIGRGTSHTLVPEILLDASGSQSLLARYAMGIEQYALGKYMDYEITYSAIDTYRHNLDYDSLYIVFNDYAAPGGLAMLYFDERKVLNVVIFNNRWLTSRESKARVAIIKNALGVFGQILWVRSLREYFGRALLAVSPFDNGFIVGKSAFSVHPTFYSGMLANFISTRWLAKNFVKILDGGGEDPLYALMRLYWSYVIPYTLINDIFRTLLIMARGRLLTELFTALINFLKGSFMKKDVVDPTGIIEYLLARMDAKTIINSLGLAIKRISSLLIDMPTREDLKRWCIEYSRSYSREMTIVLKAGLANKLDDGY